MLRSTTLAGVLAGLACGPHHGGTGSGGDKVLSYAIVTAGRPSGNGELRIHADGSQHTHFTFNDRGRGPDVTAEVVLGADQSVTTLAVSGHGYFGQPAKETVEDRGGTLAWSSPSEHGQAPAGGAYYMSINEGIAVPAAIARACLHSAAHRVKLLPSGEAWLEEARPLDVEIAGHKRHLTGVALGGTGFTPYLMWLDEDEQMFAQVSPWISLVREGAESSLPALIAADQQYTARRSARLAATLAHKPPAAGLAITHAALFDAVAKQVVPDQTVIVAGDQIVAVGNASTPVPPGAQVIDAHGKTLLPGLWDMHVHLGDNDGMLDLASGVTTVRDLGNEMNDLLARAKRLEDGTEVGPTLVRAGLIDGPGPLASPAGLLAATKDEALAAVKKYADAGYVQVKLYSSLDPALVPVIAQAAHERGLRVSGHIPNKMKASQAVEAGYDEIQHVNFLFLQFLAGPDDDTRTPLRFQRVAERAASLDLDGKDVQAFLDLLIAHHTVLDPTLTTFEDMFVSNPGDTDPAMAPYLERLPAQFARGTHGGGLDATAAQRETFRASYKKLVELVGRAWKRGIPIVAGTDATAGLSLPRELELYVQAGIPPAEVLSLASLGAARVMHQDGAVGAIAAGKRADLVLVDGDPLQNIGAVRNTDVVIARGVVYRPNELWTAVGMQPRR